MIRHELRMPHPREASRFMVWDLTVGRYQVENAAGTLISSGPGPKVGEGVEGMGHPEIDVFSRETPRSAGSVRTGTRAKNRKSFLPMAINQIGSDWVTTQALFWDCLSPDRVAAWRVYRPDGTWRELNVYLDPRDTIYEYDPTKVRLPFGVAFEADEPLWLGPEEVALTASSATATPFFGVAGTAPPLNIVSGSANGTGFFFVTGDVEVWPVFEVSGPATGFRVSDTMTGATVSGAVTVAANQKLVIDFDPRSQAAMLRLKTATSGGTNVTAQLTDRRFFPVAPTFAGELLATSLSMVGAGEAKLSYRPKYWRAL